MAPLTVTITYAAGTMPAAPLAEEQPQYRHVGHQRFMPANEAARLEVTRWNAFADAWNARTARSVRQ